MEVHAHSHTPRKKWTHHFWEFLMLFLAVTAGFFADNLREQGVDHHREKKYITTLAEDLKKDIREIDRIRPLRIAREDSIDALISLLAKNDKDLYVNDIYRLVNATEGYESFLRNDRTIQQLKSAAGMRLIKEEVAAGIMKYDNYIISEVDWNNHTEAERIGYYKQQRFELLNVQNLRMAAGADYIKPLLLPATDIVINKVAGALYQVKRISETCRESADTARQKATDLLSIIDEKYHIH